MSRRRRLSFRSFKRPLVPSAFGASSGRCPPTTAALCLEGPAGPAWRREGGPSVPSPATWPPRGEGGVEGAGAEEAGQREKRDIFPPPPPLFFFFSLCCLYVSGLRFACRPLPRPRPPQNFGTDVTLPLYLCISASFLSLSGEKLTN